MNENKESKDSTELKDLLVGLSESGASNEEYAPSSNIELTHEIVETMFDANKIKMITDLTEIEIRGILKLSVINEIVFEGRKSIISKMCNEIMMLKVSKNRGGRREMIKAIYYGSAGGYDEPQSRFKRFIG